MRDIHTMKVSFSALVVLMLAESLLNAHNAVLKQALVEHQVEYNRATQLTKADLGSLLLIQDSQDPRRIQVRSVCQSSTGRDPELRGASCGYHSLRNGILCARALVNQNGQRELLLDTLASTHLASKLFGTKKAPWRLEIGSMRNEATIRKIVQEYASSVMVPKKEGSKKEFDLLLNCVGTLHLPVFSKPVIWEDGYHYAVSRHDMFKSIISRAQVIARDKGKDVQRIAKALKNSSLEAYFPCDIAWEFVIDFEGRCYEKQDPTNLLALVSHDLASNWVQSDEILLLSRAQQDHGLLEDEKSLFVATYGENHGGVDQHAFATETFMQLYSIIRSTKLDCVGVVLVYISGSSTCVNGYSYLNKMSAWVGSLFNKNASSDFAHDAQSIQSCHDNGHWVTLVVSRIKGALSYYVLDSINVPMVRHERINEVIDILDGRKCLPGYSWTAQQVENQVAKNQYAHGEHIQKYSWLTKSFGVLAMGVIAYVGYSYYHKSSGM